MCVVFAYVCGFSSSSVSTVCFEIKSLQSLNELELTAGIDWSAVSPWSLPVFLSQHSCALSYFALYVGATELLSEQKTFYPLRNFPVSYLFFDIRFLA